MVPSAASNGTPSLPPPPKLDPAALDLPVLARRVRSLSGLCVEWLRVAPFELAPTVDPDHHRISLVLAGSPTILGPAGQPPGRAAGAPPPSSPLRAVGVRSLVGQLNVLPARRAFGYRSDQPTEVVSALLTGSFLAEVAAESGLQGADPRWLAPSVRLGFGDDWMADILRTLARELAAERPGGTVVLQALARVLAVGLLRRLRPARTGEARVGAVSSSTRRGGAGRTPTESSGLRAPPPGEPGLAPWRLRAVLGFVDAHLHEDICLTRLAEAAGGLSRWHFVRLFRRSVGVSPYQYVLRCRVERAITLLRVGRGRPRSLGEVAFACGFRDQSVFTRVFRQFTGTTPGRYRDRG